MLPDDTPNSNHSRSPLDVLVSIVAELDPQSITEFVKSVGEAISNKDTLEGLLTGLRNSPECYAKVAQSEIVTRPLLDPDEIYCNSQCPFLTKNDSLDLSANCSLTQTPLTYLEGFIANCGSNK